MADTAPDPHILAPGHAPTPFTADEIRDGCPEGRHIRLILEVDGTPVGHRANVFRDCDAEGAIIESQRLSPSGEPVGPPDPARVTWLELQGHASFPADAVTIEPETIETPLGRLDCLRYTVPDGPRVGTFWFATTRPGMPVVFTTEQGGVETLRVTMIEDVVPGRG